MTMVGVWFEQNLNLFSNNSYASSPLQEQAFELSQKYKEGKFIIELSHMIKDNGWDWEGNLHLFFMTLSKVASPRLKRVPV